ncbi:MAG: DUF1801 domain-containing protein [Acidobacteriota bacterium]|nr:DUF1801 domain-containing protein [Acidobacteriota bacterium]
MAEAKTKPTKASVKEFIGKITDEARRKDCQVVRRLMSEVTGEKPEMWGTSIIGFGRRTLKYAGGREAEWMITGFSPRKNDLTLYIPGLAVFPDVLKRLGKHKTSKGCLYLKKLADVDLGVLRELVEKTVERVARDKN